MPPPAFPAAGDPVVSAVVTADGNGTLSTDGNDSTSVTWLVRCNRPDAYPGEIASSSLLPQRGDPLRRYRPSATGFYPADQQPVYTAMAVVNSNLSVASYSFRQDPTDPCFWRVTVQYEQTGDPTTLPAEFVTDRLEYQTYENLDLHSRPVDNSAYELMGGGMPVDRSWKVMTITRALPYDQWHSKMGDAFLNTLNRYPFVVSRQFEMTGVPPAPTPVVYPPGSVRIRRISEQEVVRSPAPLPANRKYFWRVNVSLHVDLTEVRQSNGRMIPVRHRYVYADAGFRVLRDDGNGFPIINSGTPAGEARLLDGHGNELKTGPLAVPSGKPRNSRRPARPSGWVGRWPGVSDHPRVDNSEFETVMNTALVVEPPGVLLTAYDHLTFCTIEDLPTYGTASLSPTGGFTYTPMPNFTGWDWFSFRPSRGATISSAKVAVFVCVRPDDAGPWWQFRSRYKTVSWSPLDALLVGW